MWSWTLLVGCRESIHTLPQASRTCSLLNPYTSGMSRMDSNNLYEEKRNTEASGCFWQNCWMPARRAVFQSMNEADNLSSLCLGTKYGKRLLGGWKGLRDNSLPAGLRFMGGTSMKRKFRAPALKSSSWSLRRSAMAFFGSGLNLSRRKLMRAETKIES